MPNVLGDQLNNPSIKPAINGEEYLGEDIEKNDRPSKMEYAGKGLLRSGVHTLELAKMLANLNPTMLGVGAFQKNKVNDLTEKGISKLHEMLAVPKPETFGEKMAHHGGENLGAALQGGLASLPTKIGKQLATYLALGGGAATQTLAQPRIEEATQNPYLQGAASIVAGLGGSLAGGGAMGLGRMLTGIKKPLPKMTAAQMAPEGSDLRFDLQGKQLDLSKRYKPAAKDLRNIQKNQQNEIGENFQFPSQASGEEVADEIIANFENLKSEGSKAYEEGLEQVLKSIENPPDMKFNPITGKPLGRYKEIIPEKAMFELEKLENSSHKEIRDYATKLREKIIAEEGNPVFLNSLKKSLGNEANYGPNNALFVGKPKQAILKKVVHGLTEDMKEQIPGYREFMKNTADQIEHRNELIEGVLGDYVSSAHKKPKEFLAKIFENENPKVNAQFQEMLSPELREKAANAYLSDLFGKNVNKASKVQSNDFDKFYRVREHLENNADALSQTLPPHLWDQMENAINKIKTSEIGVPRGDFVPNVGRDVKVGDEAKLLGMSSGFMKKMAGHAGMNKLRHNEMLGQGSPLEQTGRVIQHGGLQTGIGSNFGAQDQQNSLMQNESTRKIPVINPLHNESGYAEVPQDYELPVYDYPSITDVVKEVNNRGNPMLGEDLSQTEESEFPDINDIAALVKKSRRK